jgi:hypothetical protein
LTHIHSVSDLNKFVVVKFIFLDAIGMLKRKGGFSDCIQRYGLGGTKNGDSDDAINFVKRLMSY